jgi:hypothetical protein
MVIGGTVGGSIGGGVAGAPPPAISGTSPPLYTLAFRIEEDGQPSVRMQKTDGVLWYAENLRVPCFIFVPINQLLRACIELTNRIGGGESKKVKEEELQAYFTRYPGLLMGDEFGIVIPQPIIVVRAATSGSRPRKMKPDFVLGPIDQGGLWRVVELKPPSFPFMKLDKNGHPRPYRKLTEALVQLQDYGEAFTRPDVLDRFQTTYAIDGNLYRPELQLIYGMSTDFVKRQTSLLRFLRSYSGVSVVPWDTLLNRIARMLTKRKEEFR